MESVDLKQGQEEEWEIIPFDPERHLEKVVEFGSRTCKSNASALRNEILKVYSRLPTGFFVMVLKETREPIGFISMCFQQPRTVRFALGLVGRVFPAVVDPVVKQLVAAGVVSKFEVANIIVDEKYQRRGIGTKLVSFGEGFIEKHFTQKQSWLFVREDNIPAIGLYKKLGYEQKDFFFFKNRKKLVMAKNLS
ncbi:MAG: N-acetyltransferase [Candidatus Norongarragalinales archaeon]